MPSSEADRQLVAQIRSGSGRAWQTCIDRYEGRLRAFVESRLRNRATAEDVVQETFMGFLTALPNYDDRTPLESYLFSIAAHKLIDVLRREGRRPTIPLLVPGSSSPGVPEPAGTYRAASSMFRSSEKRTTESSVIGRCLADLITQWKQEGQWERLQCMELLFVLGWANKDAASRLQITEQAVANHKYFVVSKLKEAAEKAQLRDFDMARLGLDSA